MRASYTSAVVAQLITRDVAFDHVSGISAGSTLTANYLSRDLTRTRRCFTDFAADPRFGNLGTFVRGKGLFNSDYIYRHTSQPGQALPFDFETFRTHPAAMRIGATRTDNGEQVWFSRDDTPTVEDLMVRVQASSTMPGLMPPVTIEGVEYVDGAVGSCGGIPLEAARLDGYDRFFVVLTRPRSYVKRAPRLTRGLRALFRARPAVAEAVMTRPARYNAVREELLDLESSGQAYVFWPEAMPVENREKDVAALRRSYAMGMAQANREWPAWRDFMGM